MNNIQKLTLELVKEVSKLQGQSDKIEVLNSIRVALHEVSPFKHHPVDCVIWEKSTEVESNEYNPNIVPPPEQKLLEKSILIDGYTMPIVVHKSSHEDSLVIVDGFHRRKSEQVNKKISKSTHGYLPVSCLRIDADESERVAATIRHNRARGFHNVDLMSGIVKDLTSCGMSDKWIIDNIGMDLDELLRLKQLTGLMSLFKDNEFSEAWE